MELQKNTVDGYVVTGNKPPSFGTSLHRREHGELPRNKIETGNIINENKRVLIDNHLHILFKTG